MLSRLISGVCELFRSNSMPCRTHVDLDLQRWDCRKVSHAHQVVGCAGEGEDPVHFAHSAMPHFAQQGDRLQPTETLFDALSLLLTETIAGMLCRAPVDCAPTAPCQVLRHMGRSEEHTSELQSRLHLACRLLLEKKKIKTPYPYALVTPCAH